MEELIKIERIEKDKLKPIELGEESFAAHQDIQQLTEAIRELSRAIRVRK